MIGNNSLISANALRNDWLIAHPEDTTRTVATPPVVETVVGQSNDETIEALRTSLRIKTVQADNLKDSIASLDQRLAAWQAKWDKLGEALIEEAERREWCHEYDQFAEANDLPVRLRDYNVTYNLTVQVNMTVTARDSDGAAEQAAQNLGLSEGSYISIGLSDHEGYVSDISYPEIEVLD